MQDWDGGFTLADCNHNFYGLLRSKMSCLSVKGKSFLRLLSTWYETGIIDQLMQ